MPTNPFRLAATALTALLASAPAYAQMQGGTTAGSPLSPAGANSMQTTPPVPSSEQPSSAASPGAAASDTGASTGTATNTNATTLSTGLTVKDNTGAAIGQITDIAADKSGTQLATIKMGADTFRLPTDRLAVQNGAAVVNLTQAQIEDELHPPKTK